MTLPSRKKRQITLSSTLRWMRSRPEVNAQTSNLTGILDWMPWLCRGATAVVMAGLLTGTIIGDEGARSPLHRLRHRNAEDRWQQARDQWMVPRTADAPESPAATANAPDLAIPLPEIWKAMPPGSNSTPEQRTPARFDSEWTAAEKTTGDSPPRTEIENATDFLPPVIQSSESSTAEAPFAGKGSPELVADFGPYNPRAEESEFAPPRVVKTVPEPFSIANQADSQTDDVEAAPVLEGALPVVPTIENNTYLAPPLAVTPDFLPGRFRSAQAQPEAIGVPPSSPLAVPAPLPESVVPPAPIDESRGVLHPIADTSPRNRFRRISEIQPFYDYTPGGGDPSKFLCPVPAGVERDPLNVCPEPIPLPEEGSVERYFAHVHYYWEASNLFHNPLYFEDMALERYGHTYPELIQPFVSIGKFGVQVAGLPYTMMLDRPHAHVYPLGYYRPGDPAPYLTYQVPLNVKAAAAAAGIYTGLFFLFP